MKTETISEQLLFSTVRIKTDKGVGTGFILQEETNMGTLLFVVTNKHVIRGSKLTTFKFTRSDNETPPKNNPLLGGDTYLCELEGENLWFFHPDENIDLCLIPIAEIVNEAKKKNEFLFIRSIGTNIIPSKEIIDELDALENVIFIGYPSGIYDSKNLLPILRRGITATPISVDYEGKPVFLIDASVFPGSSGSPVFIYNNGSYSDREGLHIGSGRIYFVGVISESFYRTEEGEITFKEIPTKLQTLINKTEMIDLGVVIKSEKVKELVEHYLEYENKERKLK